MCMSNGENEGEKHTGGYKYSVFTSSSSLNQLL